ncbi:hypothetical protein L1887_09355 [Cichorium endivia]|nr:hypothetical protein L1887_09355 [Cichorium endivia]
MNGRLFSCLILLQLLQMISAVMDTIPVNQYMRDGETVISAGEMFELGFFSPGNSKNRYLGIWYYNISPQTVVWVANRDTPLANTSGVLKVSSEGILLLLNGVNTVWSSNLSVSIQNIIPVAQLLDDGNLILRNESNIDAISPIWQSFDYPTDTILPGMKLGKDLVSGRETRVTSWKSLDDPSAGLYVNWLDADGYPQTFLRRGSVIQYRFGPWNGIRFSGYSSKKPNPIYTFEVVINQKEVYFKWELINSSFRSRVYLNPEGSQARLNWIDPTQGWIQYLGVTVDMCAQYGQCGPYGICDIKSSPICRCIDSFEPVRPKEWKTGNWSSGCQRKKVKKPLGCVNGYGFQDISGIKLPDSRRTWYNVSMSLAECKIACKRNCSCTAYTNLDIRRGGSGCLLWFGNLIDIREFEENQVLYIKIIAMTESTNEGLPVLESGSSKKRVITVVLLTSAGLVMVGLTLAVYFYKKKISKRAGNLVQSLGEDYTDMSQNRDVELPSFSLAKIAKYTNHFSVNNKLGEGGFGPVYKMDGK